MQPLDDDFARRFQELKTVLVNKFTEQWIENEQQNRIFDLEEYRKDLAKEHPEMSRQLEQMTFEKREEALKQLTMVEAVAYAIVWAMDHLPERSQ
jgi:hypothetical protein